MKKTLLSILLGLLFFSGARSYAQKEAYAFLTRNYMATAAKFDLKNPGEFVSIAGELNQTSFVLAAARAKNTVYAYTGSSFFNIVMPGAFSRLSLEGGNLTDEILAIYSEMEYLYYDMAYDHAHSSMYAIGNLRSDNLNWGAYLIRVDIRAGEGCGSYEVIARMQEDLCALAVDYGGAMFGMGLSGTLYRVDPSDGTLTVVGETGLKPAKRFQSMDFDHETGVLYWSAETTDGKSALYTVNTLTGEAEKTGDYPQNYDFVSGFTIPFAPGAGVPAVITDFEYSTETNDITLSWTNPTKDYSGKPLESISKIEVYRDETLLSTGNLALEPGAKAVCSLTGEPDGLHLYKIVAYNQQGKGVMYPVRIVAGYDVPATVSELAAEVGDKMVTLRWKAPVTGKFGGTIDRTTLRYRIVRLPDFDQVETDETTYTDRAIPRLDNYTYEVRAVTDHGAGEASRKGPFLVGDPYEGYFACDFSDRAAWGPWTVIDANGDFQTWQYASYLGQKGALYEAGPTSSDDWLIMPPVRLSKGMTYQLRFDVGTLYYEFPETLEVKLGKKPEAAAMGKTLMQAKPYEQNKNVTENVSFTATEDGVFYLAFHVVSPSPAAGMFIGNVALDPKLNKDLTVVSLGGSVHPTVGKEYSFPAEVKNVGKDMATQYTVFLLDEAGSVLAEKKSASVLRAGGTTKVSLPYVPQETGLQRLRALVVLENDQLSANDTSFYKEIEVLDSCVEYMEQKTDIGLRQNGVPAAFASSASASQVIYTAGELKMKPGVPVELTLEFENANGMVAERPLQFYMANTNKSSLKDGWIPAEDFVLVYSDTITFNRYHHRVTLPLNPDFVYTGGNLCLMTVAPLYPTFFGPHQYWLSYERSEASRYWAYATGESVIEFDFSQPGTLTNIVPSVALRMEHCQGGEMSGKVVRHSDGSPLAGARVQIEAMGLSVLADAAGKWNFSFVPYSEQPLEVLFSSFGYRDSVVRVSVTKDTVLDMALVERGRYAVRGTVKDAEGNPVASAQVRMKGYQTYTALTDAEGNFAFDSCYEAEGYTIEIFKSRHVAFLSDAFAVREEGQDLGVFMLEDRLSAPGRVVAEETAAKEVNVRWHRASDREVFRRDNGIPNLAYGAEDGTDKTVLGMVFRQPARLTSMSWMTSSYDGIPHRKVNVFVFDLDAEGLPTGTLLYSKMEVPNTDSVWMTHVFEQEVTAPRGFMIALSYREGNRGYLGVVNDLHGYGVPEDYPFLPNTQYFCEDYTKDEFVPIENFGFSNTMFLRAEGEVTGLLGFPEVAKGNRAENGQKMSGKKRASSLVLSQSSEICRGGSLSPDREGLLAAQAKSLKGYEVWRMAYEAESVTAEWKKVTAAPTADTAVKDTEWKDLAQGLYRYAVRAVYSNNLSSDTVFSNRIGKDMDVALSLKIGTNVPDLTAKGAAVVLANLDYPEFVYRYTLSESGSLEETVLKGRYSVAAGLAGFEPLNDTVVLDKATAELTYELKEMLCPPAELAVQDAFGPERTVSWSAGCPDAFVLKYEVYLDEVKVGETEEYSFRYTDLSEGYHTAGVKALYRTGASEMSMLDFLVRYASNEDLSLYGIRLYPNPAAGQVKIEGAFERAEVADVCGRILLSRTAVPGGFWVENLKSGVYFVRFLLPGGKTATEKLVVR